MKDVIKREIKKHALEEAPNECCGILLQNHLTKNLEIFRCQNSAGNKAVHFSISPSHYLKASLKGDIIAFYHSHNSESDFSDFDKMQSENHNVKFILYCVESKSFSEYSPTKCPSSYTGRDFRVGVSDCLTLMIDYYRREGQIEIKNYYRGQNWFLENPDCYEKFFEEEGFVKILDGPITDTSSIKKHDGILMKYLGKNFPTHAGAYVGNDLILHHQANCYSRYEIYNEQFKQRTVAVIRHKRFL